MKKITTLIITLILLLSVGCQRKELMDPHDHYNLIINAHFDEEAQLQLKSLKSGYAKNGEPRTTSYVLYEKNTQKIAYKGSFNGIKGGMFVQEGIYDALVYTTDFNEYDANFFRNLNDKTIAETYTRQSPIGDASPRTDVTEMYIVEPDPTFSALVEDIIVLAEYENQTVDVDFVQKSFKYYLTIKAKGLHNIHTATMNISGMYTTAYLTNEEHRENESGTQSLEMEIRRNDLSDLQGHGELYGEFWSFGPNLREDISNSITLYFVNGDVIVIKLKDLTSQIKQLTRGGEIIVEEQLEIRGPGGGFQPGVGDWDNQTNIEIIL